MIPNVPHETPDRWLAEYFKSQGAGAEFMLPWTVDTYFTTVSALKALFSPAELKTIIDAYQGMVIDSAHLRLAQLLLQVTERCAQDSIHERHGARAAELERKCRLLDDSQAAVLILWASAFWRGQYCTEQALEKYITIK